MSDLSNNNSFIPKRGPVNKKKQAATSRPVYVFTIISYVLMFATLIATAGVYLYSQVVDKQLNKAVADLNSEISSFNESDMQRVLEFDLRLSQAKNRLNNSVSVASVFDALEDATIDTVRIANLDLKREDDERFVLETSIETNSFDSTIFQRGIFQRNQIINDVEITNLRNGSANNLSASSVSSNDNRSLVTFLAELSVPLSSVPYVVNQAPEEPVSIVIENDDFGGGETEGGTAEETEIPDEDEAPAGEEINNENI